MKRNSRRGRGLLGFFIHTEMDAIFQPIKKSDTYQIRLLKNELQYLKNSFFSILKNTSIFLY